MLLPFFDPVYRHMDATMEVFKKFIAIHFLCMSLPFEVRFPKRKKKKKKSTVENYPISKGLYMAWRMGDIWSSEEVPHLIFFFMEDILKHL